MVELEEMVVRWQRVEMEQLDPMERTEPTEWVEEAAAVAEEEELEFSYLPWVEEAVATAEQAEKAQTVT
jgi:hypothetical protein